MHKDIPCGVLSIDRVSGMLSNFSALDRRYLPFLGTADEKYMKIWWSHRAVPGSRQDMEDAIRLAGCDSNMSYLAKNLALSLTDTYWICPAELELSWDDVNLYRLTGSGQDVLAYHSGTSYDPNASLGGQMHKYWDISGGTPILVKRAYEHYGQQSVNEIIATELHRRQNTDIPFVEYFSKESSDNAILSCCKSFTSESIEFVPAYEVLRSRKLRTDRSDYDHYIDICEENGIERTLMQHFMDYMTLSDFVITNTDEHLQNFGLLRDTETMQLLGPAPIFDSGNSMFFNIDRLSPLSRKDILELKISSMNSSEEKMLHHIKDRQILIAELLPAPDEVKEIYMSYGIPEERADFISASYTNKLSLLRDYQSSITISAYHEGKHILR